MAKEITFEELDNEVVDNEEENKVEEPKKKENIVKRTFKGMKTWQKIALVGGVVTGFTFAGIKVFKSLKGQTGVTENVVEATVDAAKEAVEATTL